MPIVVGSTSVVTPATRPPVTLDLPSARWIDPYGVAWPLMDRSLRYWTTQGIAGVHSPPPVTITSDSRDEGGEDIRDVWEGPRLITWPLFVDGVSHMDFLGRWRALTKAFASTGRRGPGVLQIGQPDGTVRQIKAYYSDGFEDDQATQGQVRAALSVLTLRCPDGAWQAVDAIDITRKQSTGGSSFFSRFMTIAPSQVLGTTKVVNPGDLPAWPVWQVTGPLSSFTATNLDTGEAWTLDVNGYRGSDLGAGETVTVYSRPQQVIGPDGSDWTGALSWPSAVLWGLDDGLVNVSFTAAGSSTGTQVVGTFTPRYRTA